MTTIIDHHLNELRARIASVRGSRRHRSKILGVPASTLKEFESGKGCTTDTIRTIELALRDLDGKRAA